MAERETLPLGGWTRSRKLLIDESDFLACYNNRLIFVCHFFLKKKKLTIDESSLSKIDKTRLYFFFLGDLLISNLNNSARPAEWNLR